METKITSRILIERELKKEINKIFFDNGILGNKKEINKQLSIVVRKRLNEYRDLLKNGK